LSIVEERTVESDAGEYPTQSSKKITYHSQINFEKLTQNSQISLKTSDSPYLIIKDLQKNYIVHYIDQINTDFRLALEYLKNLKTLSIDLHCRSEQQAPSYIQIASKKRCYVFNMHKINFQGKKNNEDFLDFLSDILESKKIMKVIFQLDEFVGSVKAMFGIFRLVKFNNIFSIQKFLFVSKFSNSDLDACCLRLFGKVIFELFFREKN
jgi:frataxin-like iron-binding protein CyaY